MALSTASDSGDTSPTRPPYRLVALRRPALHGVRAFLLFLVLTRVATAASYAIVDLGTLGGRYSTAYGINASGQVTGYAETATGQVHAFLWQKGAMADLGTSGGSYSEGRSLNDTGEVVGISEGAFFFNGTNMTALPNFGGNPYAEALGINDPGRIVGWSYTPQGAQHAFLYSAGTLADLGTLGGSRSQATAINAAGFVAGWSAIADGSSRAFLWGPGRGLTDLGTLGGAFQGVFGSAAYGINTRGQVVGYSTTASGGHAFRTAAYRAINPTTDDLGTLGGTDSEATGINTAGQVVGLSSTPLPYNETHAFVYRNHQMWDLNALIPPGSGWLLRVALAINDAGQIVGQGYHNGGVERAFLVTPVR